MTQREGRLEEPGRGGGSNDRVSQWFVVRRKGERGVAGLVRGLRVAHRDLKRGFRGRESAVLGSGPVGVGDGGAMEQRECGGGVSRLPGELGARWSLLGMRPPGFPSPTLPSPTLAKPPGPGLSKWTRGWLGAVRPERASGSLEDHWRRLGRTPTGFRGSPWQYGEGNLPWDTEAQ